MKNNWLIDGRINWLMGRWFDGLLDWLIDWLIDRLIDWLNDWLIDWLINCLIDWLSDSWIDGLIDWWTDGLMDWWIDGLIGGLIDWGRHPEATQEASKSQECTQEAPRRHPGGTQETPKRHPGAPEASGGIFLINHHHSHAKCKNFPGLIISPCVFDSEVTKHCKLLCKMLTRSANVAIYCSRALYQHRKNPYSQKLFGEYICTWNVASNI